MENTPENVGEVWCGRAHRHEPHAPHNFRFQAEDDSPAEVIGECPGWQR